MPELPEVETVRAGLARVLTGRRLIRVEARRPDLRFPFPEGFVQRLTGARVEALTRRGKYMLASLDRGATLILHLGMTGRFEIADANRDPARAAATPDARHAHVLIETEDGALVTFYDPRRFGFMDLVADEDLASHPRLAGLGVEPLGPDFDDAYLGRALAGRRQSVKTLLLDQRLIAGLGNIYVCEALHLAKVSPTKPGARLSGRQRRALTEAIREVLQAAIIQGGSTLRDFASAEGELGYFQHRFQVYGREGEPCLSQGCTGRIRRRVQSGRSSFFCPRCQK